MHAVLGLWFCVTVEFDPLGLGPHCLNKCWCTMHSPSASPLLTTATCLLLLVSDNIPVLQSGSNPLTVSC